MTNKEQLAADLFASFQDFQSNAPTPGGSANANKYVADKLADAIGDGIERGSRISFKGAKTVAEINYLPSDQKQAGDMYLCTTSGRLDGKNPLEVNENTAVIWDGASWHKFIEIDLSDYYTKEEVDGAVSLLQAEIGEHKEDTSNPHQVTAEQVGADPAGTAERLVEEHNLSEDSHLDIRQAILDESDARQAADETIQGNIDAETSARENADATLQGNLESEATEREQADGELQAQIDAISSRSDVVDVVASYAELVAYDTSTLADNDVIKVLEDETHEDAIAYYRWSTTTEAWSFIGSQGPYYTISQTDTLLAGKVDKVSGKGLSTNDYTTAEKGKLAGIADGADKSPVKFFSYVADYADIEAAMPYASYIYNVFLVGKEDGTYPRSYALVKFDRTDGVMVFAAMRDDSTLCTITKTRARGTGWSYHDYPLAPQSHASSDTTYGTGTSSNYGHVKLSDSTSSTSGVNDSVAATPSAVKAAYDLANNKMGKVSSAVENNLASFNSSGQVIDSGSSKDLLNMVGHLFSKNYGSGSTAVGCRVLRLPATADFHASSFIVRITNRNSNSGASARFGEIYAILSVSHRGSYFHLSFNSLSAKRFDGRMYASSPYITPNENTWRVGYKQVTVSGVNYYDIYLWAVIGNSAVTIPFTDILMTPFDYDYNNGASVVMEDITAAPSVDDYWPLRYPVTHNMDVTGGSEDRPAYVNANGEVQQGNLIINRGSHSTVTLDFTGTLGSNANTWYFV